MSWTFRAIGSDDIHVEPVEGSRENHVLRRYYWGLLGETEVRSPSGAKDISLQVMVGSTDDYSRSQIMNEIMLYESEIGEHGDLSVILDGAQVTYDNCTLDSVERVDETPKPDIAGTLHDNPVNDPSYYQTVRFRFRQIVKQTNIL